MSTIINTIPNSSHINYTKRQRYEFEIFDKSIKEIENLFKQDIHIYKTQKLQVPKQTRNLNTNILKDTHTRKKQKIANHHFSNVKYIDTTDDDDDNYIYRSDQLDNYLKKNEQNQSYKSLFNIQNQPPTNKSCHKTSNLISTSHSNPFLQTVYPNHDSTITKIEHQQHQQHKLQETKTYLHPSILQHIKMKTFQKIEFFVNDIITDMEDVWENGGYDTYNDGSETGCMIDYDNDDGDGDISEDLKDIIMSCKNVK